METAPIIPSGVTNLLETFTYCSNLTGDLIINVSNLEKRSQCLKEAAINEGCDLKLSGSASSSTLVNLLKTKSSNSHISLK